MSPLETLSTDRPSENVLVISLNRPERLNAQTPKMFTELADLAEELHSDDSVRAVILTGVGKAFCAGYDLDEAAKLSGLSPREMYTLQSHHARAVSAIRSIPQPLIAAVNGAAAGGGMSLALVADIRICSEEARFNAAFVRIGLSAGDLGCSWYLPRIVGAGLAAELLFTGRFVAAEEALRIGLVNRVTAAEELQPAALEMAAQIAGNSPIGVELSKRVFQANLESPSFQAALETENRGQALASRSPDMEEALLAFREKRQPTFTGE